MGPVQQEGVSERRYNHPLWPGPAMRFRHPKHYPSRFKGFVPLSVRPTRYVAADAICGLIRPIGDMFVVPTRAYPVWTNSYGAVTAYLPNGERLGLKPDEFEVVDWFDPSGELVFYRGATASHIQRSPDATWCGLALSGLDREALGAARERPCRRCEKRRGSQPTQKAG